jgi:hypothetical protein
MQPRQELILYVTKLDQQSKHILRRGTEMYKGRGFSKIWFLALLLVTFIAGCGTNDSPAQGTGTAVTAFSLGGSTGTVDEAGKTIAVTRPSGTNVTALVATFAMTGATVKVGAVPQTSGTTQNNFTSPVVYTVTSSDGTSSTYTVTVTVAPVSANAITSYTISGVAGTINETAKTIAVTLPNGAPVTALVATFTTSGTTVKVGTALQTSGTTPNNFTGPLAYTVTAGDSTTATYAVTVNVSLASAKAISAYALTGVTGTINEAAKTITVTVPSGTDLLAQVATFTTTGASAKVAGKLQTSGTTANDFSSPVTYTVTAADNTTSSYLVTVTLGTSSAKAITAYSLAGANGIVDEAAKTISVTVPGGTNLTALTASFVTTGKSVKVGTLLQKSGTTANDFTNPVDYTVTAGNASTAIYTVTVTALAAQGPATVLLGKAGNYVILAESGVSTVPASAITGDVGLSPAAASFLTGFSLTMVGTTSATATQVTGSLFAADMTTPTSSNLTTAITDMGTAYTDAAGRPTPDFLDLGAGEIGTLTLRPGLYKWTTAVTVSSDVTLTGGPNDIWIFQIPQTLAVSPAKHVFLSGGASAKNVFWQVAGGVSLGTTSHFEGIILSQTSITLGTGASMTGRALAQTAVILDRNAVTKPN